MLLYILTVATVLHFGLSQILPGTVPSLPNPTLEGCQKDAGLANLTNNYTTPHAKAIHQWCSLYDDVIPCVDMALPYTRLADVNDWYLSLMFDLDVAYNISEDMCTNWETYADDMACIERSRRSSLFCIKFQTTHLSKILLQLYYTNSTENPYADVNACLYANYTANCMIKHMKYCSEPVRKIVHQYYSLLNGKCGDILLENALEHRNKTATATAKRQKQADSLKALIDAGSKAKILLAAEKTEAVPVANNTSIIDQSSSNSTTLLDGLSETASGNGTSTSRKPRKRKNKRKKVKEELKKLLSFVMKTL